MIEQPPRWDERETEMTWCACCGEIGMIGGGCAQLVGWSGGKRVKQGRCLRHRYRNPCAIAGCKRTTSAAKVGAALDQWLCGEHWRAYVPPRSAERRAYHRFWRLAKRRGWDEELERRFWRFWAGLVARARRRAEGGHIDVAEINRIMGW